MKLTRRLLLTAICPLLAFAMLAACGGGGSDAGRSSADAPDEDTQLLQPAPEEADSNPPAAAPAEQPPDTQAQTAPGNGDPADAEAPPLSFDADMGIGIDGEWFPIWQDASGLLQALGDGYELYAAPSCVFDEGDDKEFAYDGIYVYTNPVNGRDMWYCVYLDSDAYPTARGISVGSTTDDVYAAYGEGFYWEGETVLTYSISGIQGDISSPFIQFTVVGQLVTAIEISYPTNTT